MKSRVLFTPSHSTGKYDALNLRLVAMLDEIGSIAELPRGSTVAVKVHPGEANNSAYLRPSIVASIVEHLAGRGLKPFVTETTTLYCRERFYPDELLRTAARNGYTEEALGCPFVAGDSDPDRQVDVGGRFLSSVGVASGIADADALLVLSHFTGHPWTAGVGGVVKQLGMGCAGRRTKAEVHQSTTISIDPEICNACGTCVDTCKSGGVEMGTYAASTTSSCVRCGVCVGLCPEGAIGYQHDFSHFAEALAEAALGVTRCFDEGSVAYLNFLMDITWHCDCEDFSDDPVFPDIGVLASVNPVAVDQAAGDMVNSKEPVVGTLADKPHIIAADDKLLALTGIEWWRQLEYAEEKGLGSRAYTLEELPRPL